MENHVARFTTVQRYARGDTRGEGKNEVRLRTVPEKREERKKWDTWRVPKEKTQKEQKLRRELEQLAQGETHEKRKMWHELESNSRCERETHEERRNMRVFKR